jgi:DNA replication protein DnaC
MTTTDTAAITSIEAAARELKLPMIRAEAARLAEDAKRSKLTYLAFLAELLETEVDSRAERRRQRRINEARFPRLKRLVDFDLDAAPTVNPATIATLAAGNYIAAGDPVVLLGDSGTGKSHLLIGLGHAACEQGLRVRYVTTAQLVNELAEAADERRLSRLVGRYGRLDLLCLDELGYVQLDTRGSELLFQILTEREEKSSVAVASNLPFSEWGKVIPDARLAAAVIDRVTFNAHIIETGTESYRLRVTRQRRSTGGGAKSPEHGGANPG